MKRTTKYAALDVHQTTTLASVREEGGRVIARSDGLGKGSEFVIELPAVVISDQDRRATPTP